jgi:phosphatidylserine/phosphatidylglycerophosphate/cardiolipin synthase-like enzyme
MTKKASRTRKRSSSSSSRTVGGLILVAAMLIVAAAIYGPDQALQILNSILGGETQIVSAPAGGADSGEAASAGVPVAETTGGSGDYFDVYFTSPVIPFDDVVTGGNEGHLVELINNAQVSIDAAMFEFNLQVVAEALIAAHERGVQVRIVYDDEHTEEDPQIEELIDAGIPATPDERSALMHNKFFVFDKQVVWTGSMNITENGAYRNNNNVIVIRSTRLAENYSAEFEEMFNGAFGPTSPANTPNPVVTLNGIRIESYFSPEDDPMPGLIAFAASAQTSIHFMAFSFTDVDLGAAMLERGSAGVELRGIFEARGGNTEFSECPRMLQSGFDVRMDTNPRTFHHKVVIVDGSAVAIGSFNFSTNAAESNDENLIIIYDPNVARLYEAEFEKWFNQFPKLEGSDCLLPEG